MKLSKSLQLMDIVQFISMFYQQCTCHLLQVLAEKKVELMEAGYMPGDAFPTDDHVKDGEFLEAEKKL